MLGNLLLVLELSQQWENFFGLIVLQFMGHLLRGSMVGLMVTSTKRAYATSLKSQVCCRQSPCHHSRPQFTRASAGDTQRQRQFWISLWGLWVLLHPRFCLSPRASLVDMRIDSKHDFIPPTILLGLLWPCIWHTFLLLKSISCEMPGWMKHKLEWRLPQEISITSDFQMTAPLWQKAKRD